MCSAPKITSPIPTVGDPCAASAVSGTQGAAVSLPGLCGALHSRAVEESHLATGINWACEIPVNPLWQLLSSG